MKTFKIIRGDEVRVVSMNIDGSYPTYDILHDKVKSLFPGIPESTSMVYRDAEGDVVTIVDDDSVRAVVNDATSRRLPNVRITLKTEASTNVGVGGDKGCRGGNKHHQHRVNHGQKCGMRRGPLAGARCFMGAFRPFSMKSVGVALGLRLIFGMSWCSIVGLALLRHFYLQSSWRCHEGRVFGSCPPWWHMQGPPNFRMSTPFFTIVGNGDAQTSCASGTKRCRRGPMSHAGSRCAETKQPAANLNTSDRDEPSSASGADSRQEVDAAATFIEEVVQSVAPYLMNDAVMVDTTESVDTPRDSDDDSEGAAPPTSSGGEESNTQAASSMPGDEVQAKVELIKSMGFDLGDATIEAIVKEMNGRVDLIVSALLKNNTRAQD